MPLLSCSALPWSISPPSVILVRTVCLMRRDLVFLRLPSSGVVSSSELTTVAFPKELCFSSRCTMVASAAVAPLFGAVRTGVSHMTTGTFGDSVTQSCARAFGGGGWSPKIANGIDLGMVNFKGMSPGWYVHH